MTSGAELERSLSSTHASGEFSLTLLWAPVLSQELDRHWEGSRDSNPNIGCLPVSKNTHVFPFGKIKLIYTIKIALKQQQSPGNREEISIITFLTLPGSFHPNWTSCYMTHAKSAGFLLGKTFLASEYTGARTQAYTYDSYPCSQTSTSNKKNSGKLLTFLQGNATI